MIYAHPAERKRNPRGAFSVNATPMNAPFTRINKSIINRMAYYGANPGHFRSTQRKSYRFLVLHKPETIEVSRNVYFCSLNVKYSLVIVNGDVQK